MYVGSISLLLVEIRIMSLKRIFIICFFLILIGFTPGEVNSNAAMPGYWNTGAGRTFFPFFPEDSIHYGKIQMQSEDISILLYSGFGVVKGEYRMYNHSPAPVNLHLGFPTNASVENDEVVRILFDDLHDLRVLVNGDTVRTSRLQDESPLVRLKRKREPRRFDRTFGSLSNIENWHVWEATFPPQSITTLTVYYIVNTNDATILRGYDRGNGCGFVYILETGEAWAGKIDSGRINIKLCGGLTENDIQGIYPYGSFYTDGKNDIQYLFWDLDPTYRDNIIVRYGERKKEFSFDSAVGLPDARYQEVDTSQFVVFPKYGNIVFKRNDFDTSGIPFKYYVIGLITGILLIAGGLLYVLFRFLSSL